MIPLNLNIEVADKQIGDRLVVKSEEKPMITFQRGNLTILH